MRLYPLSEGTEQVTIGDATYKAADDGGFDFPPDLTGLLHSSHVTGRRQWETSIEQQHRLIAEDAARRADPATHLEAAEKIAAASEKAAAALEKMLKAADAADPGTMPAARKATAKAGA